ncbi:glycerol-3-phosphate dehydrogenase [Candidatus Endobugula sertula]|uniref:Glycerol-3-phosphate dehydrogenase [NAD(P)+] n=1 Tax=Candidatus Endobugula sertula TaxID=62101 RepID=A0A1D2QPI0_9GAMM|nr:glycerol-3-phosphate dehydrogenase [Candidatus Endobugula sertula]
MMNQLPNIAVLGGGSFGTALANTIAMNDYPVYLWMRDSERANRMASRRINEYYLPGFVISGQVLITSDLEEALSQCQQIFVSVPSASFRLVVKQVKPLINDTIDIISTAKGIDSSGFTLMSQILEEELPNNPIGVLSGPNFAKEMIQQQLTGSVIASENTALIERVQQVLCSSTFRVYSNGDRYGVELAGALKNIYAVIVGMAQARQCGHNTLAMLMTRALAEMGRFSHRLGANPMTFLGLAGVGDLILTCGSDLSRNYRLGYSLGCGKSYQQAVKDIGQVVEGVNTLRLVKQKADDLQIYMPLMSALYALVFDEQPVDSIIKQLMAGEHSRDVDFSSDRITPRV